MTCGDNRISCGGRDSELAIYRCRSPQPVPLRALVRVAGTRAPSGQRTARRHRVSCTSAPAGPTSANPGSSAGTRPARDPRVPSRACGARRVRRNHRYMEPGVHRSMDTRFARRGPSTRSRNGIRLRQATRRVPVQVRRVVRAVRRPAVRDRTCGSRPGGAKISTCRRGRRSVRAARRGGCVPLGPGWRRPPAAVWRSGAAASGGCGWCATRFPRRWSGVHMYACQPVPCWSLSRPVPVQPRPT